MSSKSRWLVPVTVVLFVWTLTTHGKFTVSGDEPHYLIVAESLVADGDLDVENNYRQNDGAKIGADGLTAGPHVKRTRAGALWSVHDIGVPVLLLPVYAVATRLAAHAPEDLLARFRQTRGLFGFSLISFMLILLSAASASLLCSALSHVTSTGRAAAVALVVALSPPVLVQSFLVFPEVFAIFTTAAVVWLVCLRDVELTTRLVALVAAALGGLPSVGHKYSFYVLGLAFLVLRRHEAWFRRQPRARLAALAMLFIVPQAALHAWTAYAWGTIAGPQLDEKQLFSMGGVITGGLGLLFDREHGWLGYAPVYLIVPACWALSWRRAWHYAVPALLLFAPMAAFEAWHGGFSPAARHIAPIAPLLAVPVALALDRALIRRLAITVCVFQATMTGYLWQHPRAFWPKDLGTNQVLEHIPLVGPLYSSWLPSMGAPGAELQGWICVATVVVLSALVVASARRDRPAG